MLKYGDNLEIKPLSFRELREFSRVCENNQPCIFDLEIVGRISRIKPMSKELKSGVKQYYIITVRSLEDEKDYFIIHVDKDYLDKNNQRLNEGDVIYAKGTLFKVRDYVYLSANTLFKC